MAITVQDEFGETHSFPDEATPEQIQPIMSQIHMTKKLAQAKSIFNVPGSTPDMRGGIGGLLNQGTANVAGGALSNVQELSKLAHPVTMLMEKINPVMAHAMRMAEPGNAAIGALGGKPFEEIDPYKAMGTESAPLLSGQGLEQALVNIIGTGINPVAIVKSGYNLMKDIPSLAKSLYEEFRPNMMAKRHSLHLEKQKEAIEQSQKNVSEALAQHLGSGADTTEQIAPKIADDIRRLHDARADNASAYFEHVLNKAGDDKIFKTIDPLITTAIDEGKALTSRLGDLNLGQLYDEFKSNPTFRNAHKLKQEVGTAIGDLKQTPRKTADEKRTLEKLNGAYSDLGDAMMSHLESGYKNVNEDLTIPWQRGIDLWRDTVEPYLSNKKLRIINRGRNLSVKNIHQAFEYPGYGEKAVKEGTNIESPLDKVVRDLPEETQRNILFSKIGTNPGTNPDEIVKALEKARRSGYSTHFTPSVEDALKQIMSHKTQLEQVNNQKRMVKEFKMNNKWKRAVLPSLAASSLLGGVGGEFIRRNYMYGA